MKLFDWLTSKTVWGALLGAGAWLVSQPHIDPAAVVQAIGTVIAAIGVRHAVAKATPAPSAQLSARK